MILPSAHRLLKYPKNTNYKIIATLPIIAHGTKPK
jgi:hypothetical protein